MAVQQMTLSTSSAVNPVGGCYLLCYMYMYMYVCALYVPVPVYVHLSTSLNAA